MREPLIKETTLANEKPVPTIEPITLGMMALSYGGLALATTVLPQASLILAFVAATISIALHSSLQHEALHGHPTRIALLNELLVFVPVGLLVPYRRFRDLHLAHHNDDILTDPYDDPESNFLDPTVWAGLPVWMKLVFQINNTLFGRIILGPAISMVVMLKADLRAIGRSEPGVLSAWVLHALGLIPVIWWLGNFATMPFWLYFLAAYLGFGLLKIRTYLEHRASENPGGRTVIITDHGPLALLFLNNNFHVVHHGHPGAPWYRLRQLYDANPQEYLEQNDGYFYKNYWEVFRKHFFRAKDPVPHPLWKTAKSP